MPIFKFFCLNTRNTLITYRLGFGIIMTLSRKKAMVPAIILGALSGFAGFLPLFGSTRLVRKVSETSTLSYMSAMLIGLLGSMVVLVATLVLCAVLAPRELLLPFVLAEAGVLIVSALVFGIIRMMGSKRRNNS